MRYQPLQLIVDLQARKLFLREIITFIAVIIIILSFSESHNNINRLKPQGLSSFQALRLQFTTVFLATVIKSGFNHWTESKFIANSTTHIYD